MGDNNVFPYQIWAGTEHSLEYAMQQFARLNQAAFGTIPKQEPDALPPFLSIHGEVAVIAIAGPLIPSGNWLTRYFGMTDYGAIRDAAIFAAEKPGVRAILLDISSGGGAVSGLFDTADLLKKIDAEIKPIWTFASGDMASAAYALGVSARKMYASKTSTVGSIGVIATHKEYSKAFKEAGIGVTVIRAGEFKALANMHEPLSDKALAQVQEQLNATYDIFLEHVADGRGMSAETLDKKAAQGREFVGKASLEVGLVDGITSFDAVMSKLQAKVLDKAAVTKNNSGKFAETDMSKRALTDQDVAALAAGAAAGGVQLTEAEQAAATEAATAAAAEAAAAEAAAAAAAAEVTESEAKKDEPTAVVDFLKGELKAEQVRVAALTAEKAALDAKLEAITATHAKLVAIAANSLSNMRVALGFGKVDAASMSVESLLSEHAQAEMQFTKKYKAGGVAAVSQETVKKPALDPNHAERVAATRFKN